MTENDDELTPCEELPEPDEHGRYFVHIQARLPGPKHEQFVMDLEDDQ